MECALYPVAIGMSKGVVVDALQLPHGGSSHNPLLKPHAQDRILKTMRSRKWVTGTTLTAAIIAGVVVLQPGWLSGATSASHNSVAGSVPKSAMNLHLSPTSAVTATDRPEIRKSAARLFELWQKWWEFSQSNHLPAANGGKREAPISQASGRRAVYYHCHFGQVELSGEPTRPFEKGYTGIRSDYTAFSVCPTWPLADGPVYPDEARNTDAAINPQVVHHIVSARNDLLHVLQREEAKSPHDNFIVGQRVRFLLDAALPDSALVVAQACQADAWWCGVLNGYVHDWMGHVSDAEQAFNAARQTMPADVLCKWGDIADLASGEWHDDYVRHSCAERRVLSARYWWLADPLYAVPGNERREAHDARSVRISLEFSLSTDGRFRWASKNGSDAFARMITRYGWPSYIGWGGTSGDFGHDGWLVAHGSEVQHPYTTFEYTAGRLHLAPDWNAVDDPASATDSSWDFNAPPGLSWNEHWWPEEFSSRRRALVAIPPGQIAMMRRDTSVLFASAHNISGNALSALGPNAHAWMFVATAPDSIREIMQQPAAFGVTVFVRGHIMSSPGLLSLEISNPDVGGIDARRRVGIRPPPVLRAMRASETALSDVALLNVGDESDEIALHGDSVLSQMLGSTTISLIHTPRVGVYWESYGFRPQDSVVVQVRVSHHQEVSALRRLGMALNMASDPNSSVNISWREPDRGHSTRTIDGAVPIQTRAMILGLSELKPGAYEIIVGVAKMGQAAVTTVRRITVVP